MYSPNWRLLSHPRDVTDVDPSSDTVTISENNLMWGPPSDASYVKSGEKSPDSYKSPAIELS